MARYYNPVTNVLTGKVGRMLGGRDYGYAMRQLQQGEHLYALCDRVTCTTVVCVDSQTDFNDHHIQFQSGRILSFDLFALSEADHQSA